MKIQSTTYPTSIKSAPKWLKAKPSLTQVSNYWDKINWNLLVILLTETNKQK